MNRKWDDTEIQFIRDNANIYSDDRLTVELNLRFNRQFTKGAVRKQRQRLNIKKTGHRGYFKIKDTIIQ